MAQAVPPPRVRWPDLFVNMSLPCIHPKLFRPLLINPISMPFERHFKLHFVLKISNLKWSNVTINPKLKWGISERCHFFPIIFQLQILETITTQSSCHQSKSKRTNSHRRFSQFRSNQYRCKTSRWAGKNPMQTINAFHDATSRWFSYSPSKSHTCMFEKSDFLFEEFSYDLGIWHQFFDYQFPCWNDV